MHSNLGIVRKTWGYENIIISTKDYCTKYLAFDEPGQTSMHYHIKKDETWKVIGGKFKVNYIDTRTAEVHEYELRPGDSWHNPPNFVHQLVCLEAGTVLETSTEDDPKDNYRVWR